LAVNHCASIKLTALVGSVQMTEDCRIEPAQAVIDELRQNVLRVVALRGDDAEQRLGARPER
jgi:hypothetical protein